MEASDEREMRTGTIETIRRVAFDRLYLTSISTRTRFDQRDVCGQTHLVDMSPSIYSLKCLGVSESKIRRREGKREGQRTEVV